MSRQEEWVCEYCIKVAYYACMTPRIRMDVKKTALSFNWQKKKKKIKHNQI